MRRLTGKNVLRKTEVATKNFTKEALIEWEQRDDKGREVGRGKKGRVTFMPAMGAHVQPKTLYCIEELTDH